MTTETQASPKRAAICARVSTASQVQGTSLETQVADCEAYAATRGWEVAGTYVDGGVSGKLEHRPSLDRLMADCRAGRLDAVIVAKHDRFGRSFRHTVALIGELDDLGIEFVSIAERIDDSPAGRLQRNMLLSIAEFERERILERTTAGMEATALAGYFPVGSAPFGWKLAKEPSGRTALVIDPTEAAVWERIANCLVDRGLSCLATARELNAAGITRRKGGQWSAEALWHLVRDTTCLSGTWTYRRTHQRQRRQPLGPPIELSVPAILTRDRHEALLAVIAGRSWSRKQIKHEWLLSGLLRSPHDRTMWGRVSARGTRNYFCSGRIAADGGSLGGCDCRPVHAEDLEAAVWGAVRSALADPDMLGALAEEQVEHSSTVSETQAEDLGALDRRIARMERNAGERLAQALAAGVDPKVAAAASAKLSEEIDQLRQRRALVASWAARNEIRKSRAEMVAELSARAAQALDGEPGIAERRRVLEVLEVSVQVTGWEACGSCGGSGKHSGGSVGQSCPDCHGMRQKALVDLTGTLPAVQAASGESPPSRFRLGA